jgi:hypothetical protein
MSQTISVESRGGAYATFPFGVYVVVAFAVVWASLTANPLLTIASVVSLLGFVKLLWRPGETPVLVFAAAFQWVQATSRVFHANYHGVPLESLSPFYSVTAATWASLAGLWVMVIGIRVVLSRLSRRDFRSMQTQVDQLSLGKVALVYAATTLIFSTFSIGAVAASLGGLRQAVLAFAGIKWAFFFLLGYLVLVRREKYMILILAAGYELVMGVGFFSGFKTPLFMLVIIIAAARPRVSTGNAVAITALSAFLIVLGLAWTAVKPEFRAYLQQGSAMQQVRVSNEAVIAKLIDLVVDLDASDLDDAVDPLFRRLDAVQYFAASMDYVPSVRPHEGGEVWKAAFAHVFMPRLLFPDKPRLPSDSEHTMAYTGLVLASGDQGTSISIGYIGDTYIDFGIPGMFVPLFLLGIYWGALYYFFMRRNDRLLFGSAFATAALLEAHIMEVPAIKLLGGSLTRFIILALLFTYLVPRLRRWLQRTDLPRAQQVPQSV